MTALTTAIVLAIWAGIGALIHEPVEGPDDMRCSGYYSEHITPKGCEK